MSRLIFITPPNRNSSIPVTSIPSRRAATAWPNSCSRIDPKNNTAAATATAKLIAVGRVERVPEVRLVEVDEEEQDDEPGRVDADADAEHPRELERTAAAEHRGIVAQPRSLACRAFGPILTLEGIPLIEEMI